MPNTLTAYSGFCWHLSECSYSVSEFHSWHSWRLTTSIPSMVPRPGSFPPKAGRLLPDSPGFAWKTTAAFEPVAGLSQCSTPNRLLNRHSFSHIFPIIPIAIAISGVPAYPFSDTHIERSPTSWSGVAFSRCRICWVLTFYYLHDLNTLPHTSEGTNIGFQFCVRMVQQKAIVRHTYGLWTLPANIGSKHLSNCQQMRIVLLAEHTIILLGRRLKIPKKRNKSTCETNVDPCRSFVRSHIHTYMYVYVYIHYIT